MNDEHSRSPERISLFYYHFFWLEWHGVEFPSEVLHESLMSPSIPRSWLFRAFRNLILAVSACVDPATRLNTAQNIAARAAQRRRVVSTHSFTPCSNVALWVFSCPAAQLTVLEGQYLTCVPLPSHTLRPLAHRRKGGGTRGVPETPFSRKAPSSARSTRVRAIRVIEKYFYSQG
ncbi:hypothetical protein MVEN_01419500 [Mycena venus]|uniref:Uncharacterized protein n=1 Tax=Mycena venus TaxID=2733690 RepID=A0A8H7CSV1_9AGAR|nr:hypothetical protein MVEN_01419500 [Mycena venus]